MFGLVGKLKVYVIMFAGFAVFAGAFYWYYQDSQAALKQYAANNANLKVALEQQSLATESLRQDINKIQSAFNELNNKFNQSRQQVANLQDLLENGNDGRDLDLGDRAVESPEVIENILNQGTEELFNCFELITGNIGEVNDQEYVDCISTDKPNSLQ